LLIKRWKRIGNPKQLNMLIMMHQVLMVIVEDMSEKLSKKLEIKKMKGGIKMQKTMVFNF
jgi:hypothetical protein